MLRESMNKIGLLTIHYGINYGSALQAYALYHYLSKIGYDVELLNYIPERYLKQRRFTFTNKGQLDFKEFIYKLLTLRKKRHCLSIFNSFLVSKTKMGKELYNSKELQEATQQLDAIIVGSDQVWNNKYNQGIDPNYYLSFANDNIKKVAYAASCGVDNYSSTEWNAIKQYLSSFTSISLRESSMVNTFAKEGIDSVLVCDPVFLLSDEEWELIMEPVQNVPDDYLLIYCLDSDKNRLIEIGNKIANEKKLKTILLSYYSLLPNNQVDVVVEGCGPTSFISLIRNASFVVTNSFHGTAFSILFNKQFVVSKKESYNSRIYSLLNELDLLDRYIDLDGYSIDKNDINYDLVNPVKQSLITASETFIEMSIGAGK